MLSEAAVSHHLALWYAGQVIICSNSIPPVIKKIRLILKWVPEQFLGSKCRCIDTDIIVDQFPVGFKIWN